MRFSIATVLVAFTANAFAAANTNTIWTQLAAKRAMLPGFHQEFEVAHTSKRRASSQSSIQQFTIDSSQGMWRESRNSGSGDRIRIFDGTDILSTEEGGDEFVRTKRKPKDVQPVLVPYDVEAEWSRVVVKEGQPCNIPGFDHLCVVMEAPMKPWVRGTTNFHTTQLLNGSVGVVADAETGLLISIRVIEVIENQNGPYQSDTKYTLKRMVYGKTLDPALFKLPAANMTEVKELSRWNAAKIRKRLGGKAAPELDVTDLQGKPVSLASFKGKTVLLDFWTTWCPPCRADAPALDKLYAKYKDQDLVIVGVSVSEERALVEKYLGEHPHDFPVVLTSENEMPRPYQIGIFPTYIVIEKDGAVASAAEGDQGFAELRKMLRKAGLELE